jgi:hypothetical protein
MNAILNKTGIFILLFCYVFAFYLGGISISILISMPLYIYALLNVKYLNKIVFIVSSKYTITVVLIWLFIVCLGLLFPILYGTYDYSFFRDIAAQGIHFFAAFPFFAYLRYKQVLFSTIEKLFVWIFVLQTIIQLIVFNSPFLSETILQFNNFDPEITLGIGANIRGKALSAATTYHLTMAYGICFILYVKNYIGEYVSIKNIVIGILIFVGIFFAGRTGFVGCLIGALGYLFHIRVSLKSKIKFILKSVSYLLLSVGGIMFVIAFCFPDFYDALNSEILPYAFEFWYSMEDSGKMQTQSTNQLLSMWEVKLDWQELIFGSGQYHDANGSYYKHVDPGILRHLLFMGVGGYLLLVLYQLFLLPVWKMDRKVKYYYSLILLFLFVMEFKSVNIGLNKFAFSITLLLSFSYFYLPHKSK